MNRAVLWIGLAAFVAACLFVPYRVEYKSHYSAALEQLIRTPYGNTVSPPDVERVWRPVFAAPETGGVGEGELFAESGTVYDVRIDTGALLIQLALVLVLTLGLGYLIRPVPGGPEPGGGERVE